MVLLYLNTLMPIKAYRYTRLSYRLASKPLMAWGTHYYTDKAKRDWVEVSASDYSPNLLSVGELLNYTCSLANTTQH